MPFRNIAGHRRLIDLLARAAERDSIPPSLIFSGPSGIGKHLVAVGVARALNCLKGQSGAGSISTGCDCNACNRIVRRVHPDVLFVEPGDSGAIKIDQIRGIVDSAPFRPFEGRRRVIIIDDADALAPAAQHALLKTLEEPPPSSVFILVTARPDVLLPTVRSRCPQLRFRPLSDADVAALLMARGVGEAQARAVAASAGGSIGHALESSESDMIEARETAHRVLAQAATVTSRRLDSARDLVEAGGSGGGVRGAGGVIARQGLAVQLQAMAALLRDAEAVAVGADARVLANPDLEAGLRRLAEQYRGDRGVRAFMAVDRALMALERNAGVKSVADWVVMQL